MRLNDCKLVFATIGIIGLMVIAYPTLSVYLHPASGEQFSQFYILGSNHTIDNYPLNATTGQNNTLYLGITNDLDSSVYYTYNVKIGVQTTSLPNATTLTASNLPILSEYQTLIQKGGTWETPIVFSLDCSFLNNQALIKSITFNGSTYPVGQSVPWNSQKTGYFCYLLFELNTYNPATNSMQFTGDFVYLWLSISPP
jgi:hypothetical protein